MLTRAGSFTTDDQGFLRNAAGYSPRSREDPFANFFFGGFGNNWVDRHEEKRYREYYSFPGLELNEAGGNDFGKVTVEWLLPPLRFRHAGVPSFYTNWARLALFTSGLMTDVSKSDFRRTIYDVGAQVDFSMVLFSNLESTFSVGYATAIEKGRSSNEVMVSLKLLR